jgi:hypothetical protein
LRTINDGIAPGRHFADPRSEVFKYLERTMATTKTTTARPRKNPTKTKLPLALAKRVASEVEAKKGQAARDDVALIRAWLSLGRRDLRVDSAL